jgi:hypothetical protein
MTDAMKRRSFLKASAAFAGVSAAGTFADRSGAAVLHLSEHVSFTPASRRFTGSFDGLYSAISGPCWRRATGSISYGRSA